MGANQSAEAPTSDADETVGALGAFLFGTHKFEGANRDIWDNLLQDFRERRKDIDQQLGRRAAGHPALHAIDKAITAVTKALGKRATPTAANIRCLARHARTELATAFPPHRQQLPDDLPNLDDLASAVHLLRILLQVLLVSGASEINILVVFGDAEVNADVDALHASGSALITHITHILLHALQCTSLGLTQNTIRHPDDPASIRIAASRTEFCDAVVDLLRTVMSSQLYISGSSDFIAVVDSYPNPAHVVFSLCTLVCHVAHVPEKSVTEMVNGVVTAMSTFSSRILGRALQLATNDPGASDESFTHTLTALRHENALPNAALSLLVLLLCPRQGHQGSAYQDAMRQVSEVSSTETLSFQVVYKTALLWMDDERGALLLYFFLENNSRFRTFLLSRTDVDAFMIPILRLTFRTVDNGKPNAYISIICVLILSQDPGFCEAMNAIAVEWTSIPWFEERHRLLGNNISLLGLTLLIFVRAMQSNIGRITNPFIVRTSLAVICNLSGCTLDIEPFPAEKLVTAIELVIKRCRKLIARGQDGDQELLAMLYECLGTLLEIVANVLKGGLDRNKNMVYALLHRESLIEGPDVLDGSARCHVVGSRLSTVLTYFSGCVDEAKSVGIEGSGGVSVEQINAIIVAKSRQLPIDILGTLPELTFQYQEEPNPGAFFIPLCWALETEYSLRKLELTNSVLSLPCLSRTNKL